MWGLRVRELWDEVTENLTRKHGLQLSGTVMSRTAGVQWWMAGQADGTW